MMLAVMNIKIRITSQTKGLLRIRGILSKTFMPKNPTITLKGKVIKETTVRNFIISLNL